MLLRASAIALIAFGTAAAAQAHAASMPAGEQPALSFKGKEVVIPARAGGAVRRYTAFEADVVYLEDHRGRWYRAALTGPCFADGVYRDQLAFRNRGGNEAVDRFTSVVRKDGRTCGIKSLVSVGKLPEGRKSIAGI